MSLLILLPLNQHNWKEIIGYLKVKPSNLSLLAQHQLTKRHYPIIELQRELLYQIHIGSIPGIRLLVKII